MASQCQKEIVADEDRTVSIEIKDCDERDISSLSSNEWLNFIIDARGESRSGSINSLKPKIQKVQPMLREVESNKKCYDPRVVSIGPYHHGKPELEAGERIKIPLARLYLKDSSKEMVHELYKEVVNMAGEARKCYAEGLTDFTDESFARMMFLDGCFILQYIYGIVHAIPEVLDVIHHVPLVLRDLFLLENQLPFVVLEVLMRLKFKKHEGEKMIMDFIKRIRGEPGERGGLMGKIENFFQKNVWRTQSHREMMQQRNSEDKPPIHFLELVRSQYIDSTTSIGCHITGDWYSRRSARDFTSVGIQFKPSKTSQLTDRFQVYMRFWNSPTSSNHR